MTFPRDKCSCSSSEWVSPCGCVHIHFPWSCLLACQLYIYCVMLMGSNQTPRLFSTLLFETVSLGQPGAHQVGKISRPAGSRDLTAPFLPLPNPSTPGFYLGAEFRFSCLCGTHLPSPPLIVLSCVIAWRRGSQWGSPSENSEVSRGRAYPQGNLVRSKKCRPLPLANVSHAVERVCMVIILTECSQCNSWTF